MKNKRGLEFSFGWLFALLVGAAILFIAIFAVVKLAGTERTVQETEAAKQFGIILTPAETSFESFQTIAPITFPTETRVYNDCISEGNFGKQNIRLSTSSGIGSKWTNPTIPVTFYNKYIFSDTIIQGKTFYVFSKSFSRPFRIADPIFLWTKEYCFVRPTSDISEDMQILSGKAVNVTDSINECKRNSKKVCFNTNTAGCDITIYTEDQIVTWNNESKSAYFEESLVYGAIFSSPEVYECQLKRLMKRTSEITLLYYEKSKNLAARADGCSTNMQGELFDYANQTLRINNSMMLGESKFLAGELNTKNEDLSCKLW